jgi:hypothetical protein
LLPIIDGWNVLDDNLLACPREHVEAVFAMLWRPETPSQMKYAPEQSWRAFQRQWARPAVIHAREVVPYAASHQSSAHA